MPSSGASEVFEFCEQRRPRPVRQPRSGVAGFVAGQLGGLASNHVSGHSAAVAALLAPVEHPVLEGRFRIMSRQGKVWRQSTSRVLIVLWFEDLMNSCLGFDQELFPAWGLLSCCSQSRFPNMLELS